MEDSIPQEEEIVKALFRMRSRKSPETQISIDHIKKWFRDAHPENEEEGEDKEALEKAKERWKLVVELVQNR